MAATRPKPLPPHETVARLIEYNPKTGLLTWLPRPIELFAERGKFASRAHGMWNAKYAGTEALRMIGSTGYKVGKIFGESYLAHRIAWLLHNGSEPEFVDHIDGNRSNNRASNLRSVSWAENARNRQRSSNNKSGVTGVHWCNNRNWWTVQISRNGEQRQVGWFQSKADAIKCRLAAERQYGFHPNHGRAA